MRNPAAKLGLWIIVALATALGIYTETRDLWQFARLTALVSIAAGGILLLERRSHLQRRAQAEAERRALGERATAERDKTEELERLLEFAADVGSSTDLEHLQRTIHKALAPLLRTHDIWLTARVRGWQEIFREIGIDKQTTAKGRGWETFPLRAGGKAIGVLGVAQADGPFSARERRFMTYAASIIAIALNKVQLFEAIKQQSITDALTGCTTRNHGLEILGRELRRAARSGTTVSLLMIDADHFKQINDRYGHQCGDAVLRHMGQILKRAVRATDLPCRYGGEEFLILLPETSSSGAAKVAETIRRELAATPVTCGAAAVSVTISCGVATTAAGEVEPSGLIGRADAALYEAKSTGRNRVHVYGEPRQETRPPRVPAEWPSQERRDRARPDRRRQPWGRRSGDPAQVH